MKQVAEQLLAAMETALEAKRAGKPGNWQGVINNTRKVFDTTIKGESARDRSILPLVERARKIQGEASRLSANNSRAGGGHIRIDMKAAFSKQPQPEIEPELPENADMMATIANMTQKALLEHFGSIESVRVFAKETFGLDFPEDEKERVILKAVKEAAANV